MDIEVKADTKKLIQLLNSLSTEKKIDIGIFGNSIAGIAHDMEFGKPNSYIPQLHKTVDIPPRSFLQVPIQEDLAPNMPKKLDEEKIAKSGMDYIAEIIKEEALNVVKATFHNEGYGNWAENDPEWKAYKTEHGYDEKILGYTDAMQEAIEGKCH